MREEASKQQSGAGPEENGLEEEHDEVVRLNRTPTRTEGREREASLARIER